MIADHERQAFNSYMMQSHRYPLLTPEEEHSLAVRSAAGDQQARDVLIASNTRLVATIAKQYRSSSIDGLELIQEGNLGLIHGVSKFDPQNGARLTTYVGWWIRAYIVRAIQRTGRVVSVPRGRNQRALRAEVRKMQAAGQDTSDLAMLAEHLGVPLRSVVNLDRNSVRDVSLQEPSSKDDFGRVVEKQDRLISEMVDPETKAAQTEVVRFLQEFNSSLKPRERDILMHYLLDPDVTLQSIGNQYGVSRERVRQVSEKIRRNLKEAAQEGGFV